MRLIYLAGPYMSNSEEVRQERVKEYARAVAFFINTAPNVFVFSPILHHSQVANNNDLPHEFQFWAERDFFMIKKSSAVWVLTMPGWRESYGLSQELEYAESIERDVMYVSQLNDKYVLTDIRPNRTPTNG